MKKIKGFHTRKCRRCNNVMRNEYDYGQNFKACNVCASNDWVEIVMDEK